MPNFSQIIRFTGIAFLLLTLPYLLWQRFHYGSSIELNEKFILVIFFHIFVSEIRDSYNEKGIALICQVLVSKFEREIEEDESEDEKE